MRTSALSYGEYRQMLKYLSGDNRLVCEVALETGLRIDDVLSLPAAAAVVAVSVVERKTGKRRVVDLSPRMRCRLGVRCGSDYLFPGRLSGHRHRSTINKAMRKAWLASGGDPQRVIAPHSIRKLYARRLFKTSGSVEAVQSELGHEHLSTTLIYVFG